MGETMEIIARVHSEFPEKFGIPRQSGLVEDLRAEVVFEPAYRAAEAVRGLEDCGQVPAFFACLERLGMSPAERDMVARGNLLRILKGLR